MSSRPTWFWTSFFSSIGVNAVLLTSCACWLYSSTKIYLPGYARAEIDSPIFLDEPAPPMPDTQLGSADGKGDAADAMDGDEPMQAREGPQAQAFLSRDPEGPGKVGQEPSMSTQMPGENGDGNDGAPAMFGAASAAEAPPPTPQFPPKPVAAARQADANSQSSADVPDQQARFDFLVNAPRTTENDAQVTTSLVKDQPKPDVDQPPSPDQPTSPAVALASIVDAMPSPPTPPQQRAQSAGGGKPGPNVAAADPAPQSDSESDPFSKKGAVQFKRGATDVQLGRKHKISRPRLGLAAQTDLLNLREPVTLVLALTLDESGKVIRVDVLKSSGSRNVDQACKVAAYEWWLEPTKDKSGKPIKDVLAFVITFS